MVKNLIIIVMGAGIGLSALYACKSDSNKVTPVSAVDNAKSSSTDLRIRTDGVYYHIISDEKNADGVPLCDAVRFYDNNACIMASFFGKPTDLVKWFGIDNEKILPGTWTLNGNELITAVSNGFQGSTRTGTLTAEGWRVNDKIVLQFVQLSFPEESMDLMKNHRPYFKSNGQYERSNNYEYDKAGSLVGINTELEVQAMDQDGDSLKYTWKVSNGSVVGEGNKVIWKRELLDGKPLPGIISVEVTDGKGGKIFSRTDFTAKVVNEDGTVSLVDSLTAVYKPAEWVEPRPQYNYQALSLVLQTATGSERLIEIPFAEIKRIDFEAPYTDPKATGSVPVWDPIQITKYDGSLIIVAQGAKCIIYDAAGRVVESIPLSDEHVVYDRSHGYGERGYVFKKGSLSGVTGIGGSSVSKSLLLTGFAGRQAGKPFYIMYGPANHVRSIEFQ